MTIKNLKSKFPKIKYISVGDGEEKENLSDLRDELNLQNDALFVHKSSEQLKVALINAIPSGSTLVFFLLLIFAKI